MRNRRWLLLMVLVIAIGFVGLQVLPMGQIVASTADPGNPPVTSPIAWDSGETEALLRRACYDCHSNETVWPWYSQIAPMRWLVNHDVNGGRHELNFSELDPATADLAELIEDIDHHIHTDMPLPIYLPLHPEANLSDAEKQALVDGVARTFATYQAGASGEAEDDD